MVTREELVEFFGEGELVTRSLNPEESRNLPSGAINHLREVGLPRQIPGIFYAAPPNPPMAFSFVPSGLGATPEGAFCLGAPNPETDLRYVTDTTKGYIFLLDSEDGSAQAINKSLESFTEFLYRMGKFMHFRNSSTREQDEMFVELLTDFLKEVDPVAFQKEPGWWPTVLKHLMDY